jgi:hypothetical protein
MHEVERFSLFIDPRHFVTMSDFLNNLLHSSEFFLRSMGDDSERYK